MGRCRCVAAELTGCQCGFASTATVAIAGAGSTADPLTASAVLSAADGNIIEALASGLHVNAARGLVAIESIIVSQGSIDPSAAIAGLSVTATFEAGRSYDVEWNSAGMTSTGADASWSFEIREGLGPHEIRIVQQGTVAGRQFGGGVTKAMFESVGVTASRTFYAYLGRAAGAGVGTHVAAPGARSWIGIFDRGAML